MQRLLKKTADSMSLLCGRFLMTTGYASGFMMLAWISNTITRSRAKRAAAIGIVNAMGNIGSKYTPLDIRRKAIVYSKFSA